MDFFTLVQWGTVCGGWGVVWVIGWAMGVGVGGSKFVPSNLQRKSLYKNFIKEILWKFFSTNIFSQKKNKVRNFFIGKISDFFSENFPKICISNSSMGTKNNQKKIFSSFREIWEKLEKIFAKKGIFDFDEIFWKKEHSDFFLRIFQNTCWTII